VVAKREKTKQKMPEKEQTINKPEQATSFAQKKKKETPHQEQREENQETGR